MHVHVYIINIFSELVGLYANRGIFFKFQTDMRFNWKHPVILTLLIGVPVSHFSITAYRYISGKGETERDNQDRKLQQIYQEKIQEENQKSH